MNEDTRLTVQLSSQDYTASKWPSSDPDSYMIDASNNIRSCYSGKQHHKQQSEIGFSSKISQVKQDWIALFQVSPLFPLGVDVILEV